MIVSAARHSECSEFQLPYLLGNALSFQEECYFICRIYILYYFKDKK